MVADVRSRLGRTVTDVEGSSSQIDELGRWIVSEDARRAAWSEIDQLGLPGTVDPEDLLHAVYVKVAGRLGRGSLDAVVPYARRTLRHVAIDLIGGRVIHQVLEVEEHDRPAPDVIDHDAIDVVRASLIERLSPVDGQFIAAALDLLTLEGFDLDPHPGAPMPARGRADRRRWAALWCAGFRDFPHDGLDDESRRQRRRRQTQRMVGLLNAAATEALVGEARP